MTARQVLLIGAGGLGGPVAMALAAGGVGLRVCDPDSVELSNLQRQIQFTTRSVGRLKVEALGDELHRRGLLAGGYTGLALRFTTESAPALAAGVDLLIDTSDDPATKFAVADAAMALDKPCIVAGVLRWGGNVVVAAPGSACLRCLFEAPPDDAASCSDAGVLGAACAIVAGYAAREATALLAGDLREAGTALVLDDVREPTPRRVRFARRPGCPGCGHRSLASVAAVP